MSASKPRKPKVVKFRAVAYWFEFKSHLDGHATFVLKCDRVTPAGRKIITEIELGIPRSMNGTIHEAMKKFARREQCIAYDMANTWGVDE